MPNSRPIIIVEDDQDDCELLMETIRHIGVQNEIRCFKNGKQLLDYLLETDEKPFIIFSDINMPVMTGKEAKYIINTDARLRVKSVPFVFLSTGYNPAEVTDAFALNIQGYFKKEVDPGKFTDVIKRVFDYWSVSQYP